MLEKYLVIRQTYPKWFGNLDIDDPEMSELLDTGFLVPLIEKSNKRSVILACPGRVDPTKFTSEVMVKAFALMCEVVFHDEETQIAGFVHMNDDKNFSMAHLTLYPLTDVRTLTKCMQNSAPMRQKQFIFFNVPPVAQKLIEFVMNVLNEKLRKRIAVSITF
jgi:CRAL/TRIO domain